MLLTILYVLIPEYVKAVGRRGVRSSRISSESENVLENEREKISQLFQFTV